jgi:hypothetical protein
VSLGKIKHGDNHATLKVKLSSLTSEVQKRIKARDFLAQFHAEDLPLLQEGKSSVPDRPRVRHWPWPNSAAAPTRHWRITFEIDSDEIYSPDLEDYH